MDYVKFKLELVLYWFKQEIGDKIMGWEITSHPIIHPQYGQNSISSLWNIAVVLHS